MKKILKWIAIVIAVLIVIALVLPFLINVNSFRPQIESNLTDCTRAQSHGGKSQPVHSFRQRGGG